ncbi:MAG: hypothetical protein Q3Y08_00425 [Butyricicoccus sp.]|nr:hypothetical protein [Butyricicoccus sp.]
MSSLFPMPPKASPPDTTGTKIQIDAGTFQVMRTYAGSCPARDLLGQRVLKAVHTASSIDGGIGTAV